MYKSYNRTPSNGEFGRESSTERCQINNFYNDNSRKPLENLSNGVNQSYMCSNEMKMAGIGRKSLFNGDKYPQNVPCSINDNRTFDYNLNIGNRDKTGCNMKTTEDQSALLEGPSFTINNNLLSDNDENIDPDHYIDLCNQENEGNPSRWTNYFSSQSSSASDNLNWKYPARNGDNKVVMETCNLLNTQDTQQQCFKKKLDTTVNRTRQDTNVNNKDHKYGEVRKYILCWHNFSLYFILLCFK